jgi:hypothetical protein
MCVWFSDNEAAVEKKATDIAEEISRAKSLQGSEPSKSNKRKRMPKHIDQGAVASEHEIAVALGGRPPVPKHLEETQKAHKKADKESRLHYAAGQKNLERTVSEVIKRNLFPTPEGTGQGNGSLSITLLVNKCF